VKKRVIAELKKELGRPQKVEHWRRDNAILVQFTTKFKRSLSNAKNVSTDQLMLYLVKLEESHPRKLSGTSLLQNASPPFYMASRSVHLRYQGRTALTRLRC